ncbi:MAG TPA: helix-turn-helix domain-containing protein [Thermoanaerobaculia bacterium]|nr:helix-turn-helix domain-containing protein [Thermoanaerobaculia bacterium]
MVFFLAWASSFDLAAGPGRDILGDSIEASLQRSYVSRRKRRFVEDGIAGLYARQQGRKRSMLTPAMEARILKWTSRKPTSGSTHWTTRKPGKKLGVSHTLVASVWKRANLKLRRIERYMASNDPELTSLRSGNEADGASPPSTRRAANWRRDLRRRSVNDVPHRFLLTP